VCATPACLPACKKKAGGGAGLGKAAMLLGNEQMRFFIFVILFISVITHQEKRKEIMCCYDTRKICA